ncbi:MAG: ATP-binding protein [Actinobacteria bacterium]|nr:ATP-binding protein [Actinomycetota bacterium]
MNINRDIYLNRLIKRKNNGMAKVITGIRRCGKSYLLFTLFKEDLINTGVPDDHIIGVDLDGIENKELRDATKLYAYVKERIVDNHPYYVFLDEIQFVEEFPDVINGLLRLRNVDVYVTGSNSKLLSTDILTEFRGRGDEVRVYPLCFSEYASAYQGSIDAAWKDYYTFGGMPLVLFRDDDEMKASYLYSLFDTVYLRDICERNNIRHVEELDVLVNILASSTGSLTNPSKIQKTFKSTQTSSISDKTIKTYIDYLEDAFLVESAQRYDVKGRKYIDTPLKYYFVDVGLRNARLRFRQQEENHIMENIIFNELLVRGYSVDVGVVTTTLIDGEGKRRQKQLEVDFVAKRGNDQCYIQSAFSMYPAEKAAQEKHSLEKIADSFRKYVIVKDDIKAKRDDSGIVTMGLFDFLLNADSLNV